ncbi:MAG: hypothetical protein V1866_01850 [archaeon]
MRDAILSIDELLPYDDVLCGEWLQYLRENFDENKVQPILVVPYQGKYLIADGHVFCYYLYHYKGIEQFRAIIIETDADLASYGRGALDQSTPYRYNLLWFIYDYEKTYKRNCEASGIGSIRDYRKRHISRAR